jgi:hypothetical protein
VAGVCMRELAEMVQHCEACIKVRVNRREPMISTEVPQRPWQVLGMDLGTHDRKEFLVVQDYFSKYLEVVKVKTTTSRSIIEVLKKIFAQHGVPDKLVTDCGPQFVSQEMRGFAQDWGFCIRTSSPEFHQSNGLAERAVATAKKILSTGDLSAGLLEYRATPLECGFSPAQLLYGRNIKAAMPILEDDLRPKWPDLEKVRAQMKKNKVRQTEHYDKRHRTRSMAPLQPGQSVWIIDLKRKGLVQRKLKEERSYAIIVADTQNRIRRNRYHLIPINGAQREENRQLGEPWNTNAGTPYLTPSLTSNETPATATRSTLVPPVGNPAESATAPETPVAVPPPQAPEAAASPTRRSRFGRVLKTTRRLVEES